MATETPTDAHGKIDITATGRHQLEALYVSESKRRSDAEKQVQVLMRQLDNAHITERVLRAMVTDVQERCSQLLEDARVSKRLAEGLKIALDMHPLADLLVALQKGRAKYPQGVTVLSVADEAGEVVHAANKREPWQRVREEALDTAVVALRLYLGEVVHREEGAILPGWTCLHCHAFNSSAKERLTCCRCCGRAHDVGGA